MKSNKKNTSTTNRTLARVLSLVYLVLAVMILNGTLVLNSSITERPFWLSSQDSMGYLTFLIFITVLFLNNLTKLSIFPILSTKKVRDLDDEQISARVNILAVSLLIVMYVVPIYLYLFKEQVDANMNFIQTQGEITMPFIGIFTILIGIPSAVAAWHKSN